MPIHNADIAQLFEEMADLLEIGDANPFRVRAYRNAARLVGELQLDIAAALAKGEALPKLPGIGPISTARSARSSRPVIWLPSSVCARRCRRRSPSCCTSRASARSA